MRTIFIGDIHGCYGSLQALIKKAAPEKEDRLIFLGDYFDRGPDSLQVYRFLRKLEKDLDCVFIRGNHEEMLLDYFDGRDDNWLNNGYESTLRAFKEVPKEFEEAQQWIRESTVYYYEGEQFNVCHAGTTRPDLSREDAEILIWDRESLCNGKYDGKLTVVGHTPREEGPVLSVDGTLFPYEYDREYPLPGQGMIDIDTGAFMKANYGLGFGLTAMIAEGGKMRFIHV